MARKKTNEEFVKEVWDLVGDEYTFLEEYINSGTKIICRHNKCGYIYKVVPSHFLNNRRCPKCYGTKRLTNEEFVSRVHNLIGHEYVFLDEYVNNKTKIRCKHNKCGHVWLVKPNTFFEKNSRCPKCSIKRRAKKQRKTNEQFIEEVKTLVGDEYLFLEKYRTANQSIKCRHTLCGYEWDLRPNDFLNKNIRCPRCAGVNKLTYSEIKAYIERNGCKLLTSEKHYINTKQKLEIMCKNNHVYTASFDAFRGTKKRKGNRCPKCYYHILIRNNMERRKSHQQFVSEIEKLFPCKYKILTKYVNSTRKILVQHNECGHKWFITPSNLLYGYGCPVCAKNTRGLKIRLTQEEFDKRIKSIVDDEYTFLEKYQGLSKKIKCRHNVCGHIWEVVPYSILNKQGCPRCHMSKGEKEIRHILNKYSIKYETEYFFKDCYNINLNVLRFDFYIPECNIVIEYDGEHHFKPTDFAGKGQKWAKENYQKTKRHDAIKNQYCADNNIPLLRIPYWEFDNIESILKEWLTEQGALPQENLSADD